MWLLFLENWGIFNEHVDLTETKFTNKIIIKLVNTVLLG